MRFTTQGVRGSLPRNCGIAAVERASAATALASTSSRVLKNSDGSLCRRRRISAKSLV